MSLYACPGPIFCPADLALDIMQDIEIDRQTLSFSLVALFIGKTTNKNYSCYVYASLQHIDCSQMPHAADAAFSPLSIFFFFFCLEINSTTKTYKFSFHLQSLFSILVTPSMQIYTFILSVHRVSVLLEENGSKELPQLFFSVSLSSVVLIAAALLLRKNNFQFRNGVYLSLALFALHMIPT